MTDPTRDALREAKRKPSRLHGKTCNAYGGLTQYGDDCCDCVGSRLFRAAVGAEPPTRPDFDGCCDKRLGNGCTCLCHARFGGPDTVASRDLLGEAIR